MREHSPHLPEVSACDLAFNYAKIPWPSRHGGGWTERVVGVGMPRITLNLTNCVFYLFGIDPKTGERRGPDGTGFVVSRPSEGLPGFKHYYGVSNHHLARDGSPDIRFNGMSSPIENDPLDWGFDPKGYDLVVIDLTDHVGQGEVVAFPEGDFLTPEFQSENDIGVGDDVLMIGYYASLGQQRRNTPVTRFGNISLLATPDAPIGQLGGSRLPCHIVDMRSRTGFSGSPVFIYRTPAGTLNFRDDITSDCGVTLRADATFGNLFLKLLGVHAGQYNEPLKVRVKHHNERVGDEVREGDTIEIPSSMTDVVPASAISELLDDPKLEAVRERRDEDRYDEWMAMPRLEKVSSGGTEPGPPTKGDNPDHREDFNGLLDAAVSGNKSNPETS